MQRQEGGNGRAAGHARGMRFATLGLAAVAVLLVVLLVMALGGFLDGSRVPVFGIGWSPSLNIYVGIVATVALVLVLGGLFVALTRLHRTGRATQQEDDVPHDAPEEAVAARDAFPPLQSAELSYARLLSDRPPSDQDNPTEADRLRFGEFVNILASVIRQSADNSPFTISIEAEWGAGKSTAMSMLRRALDATPADASGWVYRTVWFDAWTYRRTEIQKGFLSTIFQAFQADVEASALTVAEKKDLLALALNLVGRAAHAGDIGALISQALDTELRYRNQFRHDFRKILAEWARLRHAQNLLLVIFVDEIDRCAPDETARVLEMMKLFFDTPGCIFVLAYDVVLVAECIQEAYKPVVTDGMRYLKKLIQVSYPLPSPSDAALSEFIKESVKDARLTAFFEDVRQWIAAQPGAGGIGAAVDVPNYVPFITRGTRRSPREIKRFLNALVVSTQVVAAQLGASRDRQIFMTLCILLLLQIRWPHFHDVLVHAPEIEEDIYVYLDRVFGTSSPADAPAEVRPIELTQMGERLRWLRDDELCRFLRDYSVRGQAKLIRQLVTIGLPTVEDVETAAQAQEALFPADTNSLFGLSLLPIPEHFIGRTQDLAWLLDQLRVGGVASIASIHGMGGIGKTALAATAARHLYAQGRFLAGIAVVPCQGKTDALEVLHTVLSRFLSEHPLPDAGDEVGLIDAAHRLLDGKDALIVLDNIEPGLQVVQVVEPLRDTGVTLLLTSRQSLPIGAVPPTATRTLELLLPQEALDLFAQSYGRLGSAELTGIEREAATRIVAALGYHTLAVKLAGAYAADVKRDLTTLADELADPHRAMDLPQDESSRALALIFQESTTQLPDEAQQLFMALTAFTALDFARTAALTLAHELHVSETCVDLLVRRALVDATITAGLPEGSARERLHLHPLVRAFAEELAARQPESTRQTAKRILCDYYAGYVMGARAAALDADEQNIEGALEWAHDYGTGKEVVDLCLGMRSFWYARANTRAGTDFLSWGIAAGTELAERSGLRADRLHVADLQLTAAQFLRFQGKLEEAEAALQQNLSVRLDLLDRRGDGAVRSQLGQIARIRGHLQEAEDDFGQSIALRQEVGDREGQAYDLMQLGHIVKTRGYLDEAEGRFRSSLAIFKEIGDRRREGTTLGYIGRVYQAKGLPEEAEQYFNESLAIAQEEHDARGEAMVRSSLGQLELARGQFARAERYLQEALGIHRSINDRQGEAGDLSQFGRLALDRGRLDEAKTHFQESLEINQEVQDVPDEGVDLSQLGLVAIEQHQLEEAKSLLGRSLEIRRQVPDPRGEGVDLSLLGRIAFEEGRLDDAQQYFTDSTSRARSVHNQRGTGVNLRYLAAIAERRNDDDQAEALYRESLQIATSVQNGLDIAATKLELGRFLIERRQKDDEGCELIQQAVRQYSEWQLPRADPARALAARLGCPAL